MGDSKVAETSKQSIRKQVWESLMKNNAYAFPRPFGRIPNFKGASAAASKMLELQEFKNAKSVEINPDKPLQYARMTVIDNDKDLFVPIPRLTHSLLKKLQKDENVKSTRKLVSRWGIEHIGTEVSLDGNLKLDLLVLGSVAVSKEGYRIGKGKGYADLEFAILKDIKAIDDETTIITIVHDLQVFDTLPNELFQKHDVPVDYILTPTQIIKIDKKLPRPEKIFWNLLSKRRIDLIKILQTLKETHEGKGTDTTLKDVDTDVETNGTPKKYKKNQKRRFNKKKTTQKKEGDDSKPNEEKENEKSPTNGEAKQKRRFFKRKPLQVSEKNDGEENNENQTPEKSPGKQRHFRRPHQKLRIDFSLLVSNIERNVRVRDIKKALTDHGVKPDDITWKGYKGFCYLHYAKPFNKNKNGENNVEEPFSVDNVIEILQSLKLDSDSNVKLSVKVMEPITRIETTDVTAV